MWDTGGRRKVKIKRPFITFGKVGGGGGDVIYVSSFSNVDCIGVQEFYSLPTAEVEFSIYVFMV